ncbi:hypothetical protein [Mycobacterium sp. OTB74]|uniref:hypothetical protein n=1 Tax=Mycobacterium sp. OTB74 TaxID=1853452 RepID=UPI0024742938|nr:hypothetical protein [Mycobacterium sp. OTB74]MDH6246036.1 hypothetical protein [Mycobacterium sp. OTB74]
MGIDGSGPSEAALRYAAHDAALRTQPLTLVNVNPLVASPGWGSSMADLLGGHYWHRCPAVNRRCLPAVFPERERGADSSLN